jgi:NAD(P)-dependent dehydrogenase (short-subunit alcohol dehydrogenase family)
LVGLVDGQVSLVTGGDSEFGLAAAILLAEEGATAIALGGRSLEGLETSVAALEARTDAQILALQIDVGVAEEVEELVAAATARFGRIDAAVNCDPGGERRDQEHVYTCTSAEIPALSASGGGAIVNVCLGADPGSDLPPRGASSLALRALNRPTAMKLGAEGIRINSISISPLGHGQASHHGKAAEVAEAIAWLCSPRSSCVNGTELRLGAVSAPVRFA